MLSLATSTKINHLIREHVYCTFAGCTTHNLCLASPSRVSLLDAQYLRVAVVADGDAVGLRGAPLDLVIKLARNTIIITAEGYRL